MKRTFFILLVLLLISSLTQGQIAISDVYTLQSCNAINADGKIFITKANKDVVIPILGYYMGKPEASFNDIITYYNGFEGKDNNPFIEVEGTAQDGDFDFSKKAQSKSSSLLNSIGGLDVTNIADGLAKFLVKRTKEELNVAFFSKLKETLNSSKYRDLRTLFPNTWLLLDAIGDEIYNYNKYLQNLKEAFMADIQVLDETLPGIIPNHTVYFNEHFGLAVGLRTSCYITKSLRDQVHPGEILNDYPMGFLVKENSTGYFNKNYSGSIQVLQLVSESLRENTGKEEQYWVDIAKVKELVKNKPVFKVYLGLLYQVAKGDRFKNIPFQSGSFTMLMDSIRFDTDYDAYRNYIVSFMLRVNKISEMVRNFAKPAADSIAFENYARYFRTTVDMLEYSAKVCELPHFKNVIKVNLHDSLRNFFLIAYETSDLATAINRRNYASAVNHAVVIYNLVRTKPLNDSYEKYYLKDSKAGQTTALYDSLVLSRDMMQKLAKYGAFMATIAIAKNSDEVEQAIETAALPSGSSRIKRESAMNVSLNAYTGLFMAHEKISGVKDDLVINNYGVAAPVGAALSFGVHHWSLSLFVSVIDIGALASFRFVASNDSVSQVPTIQLQDILSPGLFFSIGIPKCPLSVNFGAQIGPNLRKVYVEDPNKKGTYINTYQDNIYLRFSASLVVDIPIFNFYTRTKN